MLNRIQAFRFTAGITRAAILTCAFSIISAGPPAGWTAAGWSAIGPPAPFTVGKTAAAPGSLYYIATSIPGDVIYLAGNLPLIISVPHGGGLSPDIPDRKASWGFINKNNDDATIELALDIVRAIGEKTGGKFPHVVINNLTRAKIDQNRGWGKDGNPTTGRGGEAWKDFHHRFIGSTAIPAVLNAFGSGLFIDLHGKPDWYGADVIIGYNLSAWQLSNSDRHLDTSKKNYAAKSSIGFLSKKLEGWTGFSELLRGRVSFGSLLQKGLDELGRVRQRRYFAVPRLDYRKPLMNLSGGYNLKAFCGLTDGSIDNPYRYTESRFISGFQLEVSRGLRVKNPRLRADFAATVADAVIAYIEKNFGFRLLP
ncbi:MAG: hypothetical protein JW807_17345 [Spirochaetes bacterium]|nr:hypothetical protein [Spirochaetota bacterium]